MLSVFYDFVRRTWLIILKKGKFGFKFKSVHFDFKEICLKGASLRFKLINFNLNLFGSNLFK